MHYHEEYMALQPPLERQQKEPELVDVINYLECGVLPSNKEEIEKILKVEQHYYLDSKGLLYHVTPTKKGDQVQPVVRRDTRSMLIRWHHDYPASGHFGLTKTYKKLRQKFHLSH